MCGGKHGSWEVRDRGKDFGAGEQAAGGKRDCVWHPRWVPGIVLCEKYHYREWQAVPDLDVWLYRYDLKYPENKGYKIESETYLRNKDGNIVKDDKTGEARRIDFVVTKDGKAVDSIEVTSKTADKTEQSAKEDRIRENGGNYIKDSNGDLIEIPKDVHTRIERRD